jgi:glycosyltransferase involved in cell wall biosynthesis
MTSPSAQPRPPLVSVVIPAYNCRRFVAETIRSIQAQTLGDWECVIVDDGSTDGTLPFLQELVAADSRFRIASQPNGGPASARNHGVELTDPRSQFFIFMDSDDVWAPEALEVLRTEVENHPEAVGAHALARCIDQDGVEFQDPAYMAHGKGRCVCDRFGRLVTLDPSMPTSFQSLWYSNPFPPGLFLSRRSAFQKTGSFDPSVCPLEDWDMLIRLSRHGDFRFVAKVLLSYRRHDSNLSGQSASVNGRQIRNLLYKTYFSGENDSVQAGIVSENWRATELRHVRSRWAAARERLMKADLPASLSAFAAGCVHLFRFARGIPTRHPAPPDRGQPDRIVSENPTSFDVKKA